MNYEFMLNYYYYLFECDIGLMTRFLIETIIGM